ncbi:hypothetical protein SLOPH_1071 [Spraguea lophii 42_110]|uniref:Uncharacterized protein n=1 Tax=Spraguea lophii (strain 42_110) TaxID=1358809 RepID=S7W744_SPRLO|nr:hypothetical protein SLOPH_1071 [Spraguea lophii 42_110]
MSLFIPEYFITKLQTLNFDNIETLTLYINLNINELDRIMIIWEEEYSRSNKLHQIILLKLLYSFYNKYENKDIEKLYNKYYNEYIKINGDIEITKHINTDVGITDKEVKQTVENNTSILKEGTESRSVKTTKKVRFSSIEDKKKFSREELIKRIDEYYDVKDRLVKYLEEFVEELKK